LSHLDHNSVGNPAAQSWKRRGGFSLAEYAEAAQLKGHRKATDILLFSCNLMPWTA
jgi:hypothetical protein